MRLNVKNLIFWLAIIAAVVALHTVRRNSTMRGIETVVKSNDICLLTQSDVDSIILASFPKLLNTDIKRVEKKKIRQLLESHPYVAEAEVGMTTGGKLKVDVIQRVPVVRMFFQGREFYISEQGTYMPLCAKHYCDVLVGNSDYSEPNIKKMATMRLGDKETDSLSSYSLESVWTLAKFIHDNSQYDGVFDQLTVNDKGDLVLTPKLGNTIVIVGDTTQLDKKFENLWTFYDKGVKKMGWDTYVSINLKYKNQLVCAKK